MPRILYTHRKGELGKLKRKEAAKPATREARSLDAIAAKAQNTSVPANPEPTLRKSTRPREAP